MCKKLGWKLNDPIGVIFASDLTDGVFLSLSPYFRDRLLWLRETLFEIRKISNVNWLVKPHPNDEINKVITDTISECKKICSDCDHIKVFPEDIASDSIPKFIHAAITQNGSVGSEFPCFGIPTVLGDKSYYSELGFTIDPNSKEEYFFNLKNLKNLKKLNNEQIELAKINVFILYKISQITSNLIAPYGSRHVNEKIFWAEMTKLLEQYNYEDDLLKKMMKIQKENNDLHAIDYRMIK